MLNISIMLFSARLPFVLSKYKIFKVLKGYKSLWDLKALRQPRQKVWSKILTAYLFIVISIYTSYDHAVKMFSNLYI